MKSITYFFVQRMRERGMGERELANLYILIQFFVSPNAVKELVIRNDLHSEQ